MQTPENLHEYFAERKNNGTKRDSTKSKRLQSVLSTLLQI